MMRTRPSAPVLLLLPYKDMYPRFYSRGMTHAISSNPLSLYILQAGSVYRQLRYCEENLVGLSSQIDMVMGEEAK